DLDADRRVWTIPAARAKNGRAHRVPLSARASVVLCGRPAGKATERVFAGLYHQRKDLLELSTVRGTAYTWHDLRRTVATRLAALGVPEETISRVLNHAKRGVTATVYNQYSYDAEKRAALEAWSNELERIASAGTQAALAVATEPR